MLKRFHPFKNNFWILLKKELFYNYFISPVGIIFGILFSVISVWLFLQDFFLINQADLNPLFNLFPLLFLFFLPAITMNLLSEERKTKTWEILLTLPTNETKIVLAKFLSALIFTCLVIFSTLPLVITLGILGRPDWGVITSGFLAAVLMAGGYTATGIFFSSLTNSSIVALIANVFFLFTNFILGQEYLTGRTLPIISNILSFISLNHHFWLLTSGNIMLSSLIFYSSWIFIFLWLTVVSLKSRDY